MFLQEYDAATSCSFKGLLIDFVHSNKDLHCWYCAEHALPLTNVV